MRCKKALVSTLRALVKSYSDQCRIFDCDFTGLLANRHTQPTSRRVASTRTQTLFREHWLLRFFLEHEYFRSVGCLKPFCGLWNGKLLYKSEAVSRLHKSSSSFC